MPNSRHAEAFRCGQLYAALAALQKCSDGPHHSLGLPSTVKDIVRSPSKVLNEHLWRVGKYLITAHNKGRGAEAAVLFRSIPDLLPTRKEPPFALDAGQREQFHLGVEAQRAEIAKALQSM
ncbi:hypothetical protein ABZS61_18920 [Streptomyces sp. NPDC005566]|uniref:hypothetical protein n=1 Tax=Streptomyces sp. NPDC005566 TaxID=3156886 RepID=UPI0033B5E0B8